MDSYAALRFATVKSGWTGLFLRALRASSKARRVGIYGCGAGIELVFIHFFYTYHDPVQMVFSIGGAIFFFVSAGILISGSIQASFEDFKQLFPASFKHSLGSSDFFRFLNFLEIAAEKNCLSEPALEEALEYTRSEVNSRRPSSLSSTPFFVILVAIWTGSYVEVLKSEMTNVSALALVILIGVTLIFLNYAMDIVFPHKTAVKLEKFCSWAKTLPREKREGVNRIVTERTPSVECPNCGHPVDSSAQESSI